MELAPHLRDAFAIQEANCARMGSPFTAHLCATLPRVLEAETALGARIAGWAEDPVASALALRLCGAFHRLVRDGAAPALAALYPPTADTGPALDAALRGTIAAHDTRLVALIAHPPQTNEVGRSGVLIGGLMVVARETGCALALNEIGASAGLNLQIDRFAYDLGAGGAFGPSDAPITLACAWTGAPPALCPIPVAARRGSDIAPLDPADAEHRARLMAYLWPDQPHRLERTAAALDLAARHGPKVEPADAADWVAARLAEPQDAGTTRVLMHSIMWQYLPEQTKARIDAMMASAGAEATPARPLAWLHLERDATPGSAALTLTLWPGTLWPGTLRPGGEPRMLARADYHGAWAEWLAAG